VPASCCGEPWASAAPRMNGTPLEGESDSCMVQHMGWRALVQAVDSTQVAAATTEPPTAATPSKSLATRCDESCADCADSSCVAQCKASLIFVAGAPAGQVAAPVQYGEAGGDARE
jgi:hypothetical protein